MKCRIVHNSDKSIYLYGVQTRKDAEDILIRMKEIAEEYGYARLADLKDLCGIDGNYIDNRYEWTYSDLRKAWVSRNWADKDGSYRILFPKPTFRHYNDVTECSLKTTDNDLCELLNITIDTKELDDPDAVLADVFKHIYTIKDRVVNISIM